MSREETRYEFRTSKAIAAAFDTEQQALSWLGKWAVRQPDYAQCLKLFKVTTTTHTKVEAVQ